TGRLSEGSVTKSRLIRGSYLVVEKQHDKRFALQHTYSKPLAKSSANNCAIAETAKLLEELRSHNGQQVGKSGCTQLRTSSQLTASLRLMRVFGIFPANISGNPGGSSL